MSKKRRSFRCEVLDVHAFRGRERLIMGVSYRICERCGVMLP